MNMENVEQTAVEDVTDVAAPDAATASDEQQEVNEVEEKPEPKRYKLKVRGQERDLSEDEYNTYAQKGIGADEKFQEAAKMRRDAVALLEFAKKNPAEFIRQTGQDPSEFAKQLLRDELENLSLDPKERELRDYKKKVAEYEKKMEEQKQREEQERSDRAVQHWSQHYDKVIPDAISKSGLPATPEVIRMVTDVMIDNLELGVDLPMDQVMTLVRERYVDSFKRGSKAAGENLIDLFDDDQIEALIAAREKRSKKVVKKNTSAIQTDSSKKPNQKSFKENEADLDARIALWANQ